MQTKTEAPATEPLLVSNVPRRYRRVTALEGVDLAVRRDEVLAVVGPSGCGKSTLLELVAGLQDPDEGSLSVAGGAALRGAPPRRAAVRALRARGVRTRPPGRALRRHAPARGVPAHAPAR